MNTPLTPQSWNRKGDERFKSPASLAQQILSELRTAYQDWQTEHPVEGYPPARMLFLLPVPDTLRWFQIIAAHLKIHGVYPEMQRLLLGVVDELEALGFQPCQDN